MGVQTSQGHVRGLHECSPPVTGFDVDQLGVVPQLGSDRRPLELLCLSFPSSVLECVNVFAGMCQCGRTVSRKACFQPSSAIARRAVKGGRASAGPKVRKAARKRTQGSRLPVDLKWRRAYIVSSVVCRAAFILARLRAHITQTRLRVAWLRHLSCISCMPFPSHLTN
jgi:hypothetical protein